MRHSRCAAEAAPFFHCIVHIVFVYVSGTSYMYVLSTNTQYQVYIYNFYGIYCLISLKR